MIRRLLLAIAATAALAPAAQAQTSCPPQPTTRVNLPANDVRVCGEAADATHVQLEVVSEGGTKTQIEPAPALHATTTVNLGPREEVCGDGQIRSRSCASADPSSCDGWGAPLLATFRGCPLTPPSLSAPLP